jgi:hypothetical protein
MKFFWTEEISGELSGRDVVRLIDIMRDATGNQGKVTEVLDSLEWVSADGELRRLHVTVAPRDGTTLIRVHADESVAGILSAAAATMAGMGIAIALGVASGLQSGPVGGISVLLAGAGGGFLSGRALYKHYSHKFRNRVGTLLDRMRESGEAMALKARTEASQLPASTDGDA